jgi:RNA polymerase sigma-70 factor (ECF subfamily)
VKGDKLLERCRAGDQQAFAELYRLYAPKMLGVCMRYAKSTDEAEDMLQEGFVRLFQNINSYENRGSFEGWVRRIIVNTAINYYKTQIKYNTTEHFDAYNKDLSETKDEPLAVSDVSQQTLLKMITELPKGYNMVFNLYVLDGYTHKEIAEILDISENTTKSQLSKARKLLQKKISKYRIDKQKV